MTEQDGATGDHDRVRSGEAKRLDVLKRLGDARGSTVITYITSYRAGWGTSVQSDDVRILEKHVARARAEGAKKVDFVVSTWGGDATVPWSFHAMVRDYLPKAKIGMILPYETYSAGTGLALGGDEIIMGRSSVLGPVDTQASGLFWKDSRTAGGVSALNGFLRMLDDFDLRGKLDDKTQLDWLTRNSDPLMLGEIYRLFRENKRKILKIMASRRQPLPVKEQEKIADFFLYDVGIHGQGIRRQEAREAGLSYLTDLESTGHEREVEALFAEYAEVLRLFVPFNQQGPVLNSPAADERTGETPVVMIESIHETNAAYRARGYDRHWHPVVPQPEPDGEPGLEAGYRQAPMSQSWTSSDHGRHLRRRS